MTLVLKTPPLMYGSSLAVSTWFSWAEKFDDRNWRCFQIWQLIGFWCQKGHSWLDKHHLKIPKNLIFKFRKIKDSCVWGNEKCINTFLKQPPLPSLISFLRHHMWFWMKQKWFQGHQRIPVYCYLLIRQSNWPAFLLEFCSNLSIGDWVFFNTINF